MPKDSEQFNHTVDKIMQVHLDAIASRGLSIQPVSSDPERDGPDFLYTLGLTLQQLDEMLVFGLPRVTAAKVLNEIGQRRLAGEVFALNKPFSIRHTPVKLMLKRIPTGSAQQWVTLARRLVDHPVEAIQLVWPDPEGLFPWEPGFDPKFAEHQKLLFTDF